MKRFYPPLNLDKRLLRQAHLTRGALLLTVLLGFAAGVLTVLQARFVSLTVAGVFLDGHSLAQVSGLLRLLLGVILLRAGLAWGSEVSAHAVAGRVKSSLRAQAFDRLLQLGPAYTRGERSGELASTLTEGIEALDAYFSQYLPQLALAALVPLTILALVFPLDPVSGVVLLLTAPLIPIFMVLIGNLAAGLTRRQWRSLSRMSAYFLDLLQGLATLKALGRSRAQVQVLGQVSDNFRRTTLGVLRVTFLSALVLELVATLSTAVVAVQVGLRLLYGWLSFEQAFFVLLLAPEFYQPLRTLGARFHAGMAGLAAAQRIFQILEHDAPELSSVQGTASKPEARAVKDSHGLDKLDQRWEAGPDNLDQRSAGRSAQPTLHLIDLHYAYADDRPALRGLSLTIEPGQKVALVGPSGGGKSTVAALLLGFIRPQSGGIILEGRPLDDFDLSAWRDQIAWVPQNPYLFHDTVEANLRIARPESTRAEIEAAARLAHADSFIQSLPDGYATVIGERGARLSGGQAQRIALARAFLKNAPFLILDEPTANLDPQNEAQLGEALDRLLAGRTALIIAHRLNTVARADRIYVLSEGRVVEQGRHADLLACGGLYHRLVAAFEGQAAGEELASLPAVPAGHHPQDAPAEAPAPPPGPSLSARFDAALAASFAAFDDSNPGAPHRRAAFLRLLTLALPLWRWIALAVLLGFVTIGSSIGLMTASAYIISAAALRPSIADLQVAIVGVRFFGITRGLFRYLERYVSHEVTFRLLARLRVWFYQALEPLAPARLLGYRSGDLLSRLLGDIETLENFYVRVLAPPLVAVLTALAAAAFLARFAGSLAVALLLFLFAAGVGVPLLVRRLGQAPGRRLVAGRSGLHVALVDGIQGLADLLAFNRGPAQAAQIAASDSILASAQRQMAQLSGLQSALGSLLANLGMWTVLLLAIPLVRSGEIAGVYLAVVTLAAVTSFEAVLPLPLAFQYLESNLEAARRLLEVVDAQPEVFDPPQPRPLPSGPPGLQVNALTFIYPPASAAPPTPAANRAATNPPALREVSFSIPPGGRVAIVGPSGAGKSTLANLLLRFWDVPAGRILLAGYDLRDYSPDELRSRIAVVSQNTYLFNASVRDNLRLARPKAGQAEIEAAARRAQIHDFIESLPQGYDTWIGEQGLRLSGGERQRLAIARALLKDPPLLILDEATANLDALTERQVLAATTGLMAGRTTLMITHRLVGLDGMDEILVLQDGRVAARGRHADLIAQDGPYRQMWELQRQALSEDLL